MIHDAQLDYYGKRLATCSSDRTIKVFDVVYGNPTSVAQTLTGHQGPVWQVAWAHPSFGPILASCSYDGKVIIWKDNGHGANGSTAGNNASGNAYRNQGYGSAVAGGSEWTKIKEHALHSASGELARPDAKVQELSYLKLGCWALYRSFNRKLTQSVESECGENSVIDDESDLEVGQNQDCQALR